MYFWVNCKQEIVFLRNVEISYDTILKYYNQCICELKLKIKIKVIFDISPKCYYSDV